MAIHMAISIAISMAIFMAIHFQGIFIGIFSGLIISRQSRYGRRIAQAHYAIDGAFLHRLGLELITAFE